MKELIKERKICRLCHSHTVTPILDFGTSPLANSFPTQPLNPAEEFQAPLAVMQCRKCGSTQLTHSVSKDVLFKNYLYESSTSPFLVQYFKKYAANIKGRLNLNRGDLVIDVGANDHLLVKEFENLGLRAIGVEPATNLCQKASDSGLTTINDFFNSDVALDIVNEYGKAKLITCNNVFAHNDNLFPFVEGARVALDNDGQFVFQNAYWLDSVKNLYFDQCYHEHIFFHSVAPLIMFFGNNHMNFYDVQRIDFQGGSILGFVKNKVGLAKRIIYDFIEEEENSDLYSDKTYESLKHRISVLKASLHVLINNAKIDGKTICAYGATAKFTTFCKAFELTNDHLDFVIDDSQTKQGRFTPGNYIPIVPSSQLYEKKPDYCILTAWNIAESIMEKNKAYSENGGKFIVPMPELKIY